MSLIKKKYINLLILLILAVGAWLRANWYGDLRLSVATIDTSSYVTSASAPFLSQEDFSSRRLFTSNLLYRITVPNEDCNNLPYSNPAAGQEITRSLQYCFTNTALVQNILSIIAWCFLAFTFARQISYTPLKILSSIIIVLFGFTPQVAEWDSTLGSESLSFSLLALLIGLLIDTVFRFVNLKNRAGESRLLLATSIWMIIFLLWGFVRDVHLYAFPITALLLIPFFFIKKLEHKTIIAWIAFILIGLFIFGTNSSRNSPRWQPSLSNSLGHYVFPFPARVEYFQNQGMPTDRTGGEYEQWFENHGIYTYTKFLMSHPGFVITEIFNHFYYFQSDLIQPYFSSAEYENRDTSIKVGTMLHPQTNSIYILGFLLLFSMISIAIFQRDGRSFGWAWLGIWIFLYSSLSLFVSFFGDTSGTQRHIIPSVATFRLFTWLFLIVQMDLSINTASGQETDVKRGLNK